MEASSGSHDEGRYFNGPETLAELEAIVPAGWRVEEGENRVQFLHPLRPGGDISDAVSVELINKLIATVVDPSQTDLEFTEEPRLLSGGKRDRFFIITAEWPIPNELISQLSEVGATLTAHMSERGLSSN